MFEAQHLGSIDDGPTYRGLVAKYWDGRSTARVGDETLPYLSYGDAMRVVKECQLRPPTDPPQRLGQDLRTAVIDALEDRINLGERRGDAEIRSVRLYTAGGSILDKIHGIDGFLEVDDPEAGKTYVTTIDVSVSSEKLSGAKPAKADILIGEVPDAVEQPAAYYDAVEHLAGQITAHILAQKQSQDGYRRAS